MVINLCLPWPPSANRYWRNIRGRTLISREAKQYKKEVQSLSLINRVNPIVGKIAIAMDAYPPDRRKRDLDNLIKIVLDSLQDAGYFLDDSQIDEISIKRSCSLPPYGELYVEIREL